MPQESTPSRDGKTAYIALGSNLASDIGGPKAAIEVAIAALGVKGIEILAQSAFYTTPSFPKGNGPDYVNAAISVTFAGKSFDLLKILHEIEAELGRTRDRRWGSRTIDLDLLAHGDQVLPNLVIYTKWRTLELSNQVTLIPDQLILPHPRLQDRGFVLVPLADVAPDWVHPVLKMTVEQMRNALPTAELDEITRL